MCRVYTPTATPTVSFKYVLIGINLVHAVWSFYQSHYCDIKSTKPFHILLSFVLFIRHTLRAVFIERAVSINNRGVAEKKKFQVSLPPTNSQLLDGVSKVGTRQTAQSFGGLLQVLADEGRGEGRRHHDGKVPVCGRSLEGGCRWFTEHYPHTALP